MDMQGQGTKVRICRRPHNMGGTGPCRTIQIIFGNHIQIYQTSLNIEFGVNRTFHVLKTPVYRLDLYGRYRTLSNDTVIIKYTKFQSIPAIFDLMPNGWDFGPQCIVLKKPKKEISYQSLGVVQQSCNVVIHKYKYDKGN